MIQYLYIRLFRGKTYLIKVYYVWISAVINKLTNTVHKLTKKKIKEENRGFKITEVRWLSKSDRKKRYGSIFLYLIHKQTTNLLYKKRLLDILGKSYIVKE